MLWRFAAARTSSEVAERHARKLIVLSFYPMAAYVGELEDGYELAFPGDAGWAMRLVEFVVSERDCCPFLRFELVFEQGGGEILLRITGPEGTKQFLGKAFSLASSP